MINKYTLITIILQITIIYACKPYDSDAANRKLIQGYWELCNIEYQTNTKKIAAPIKESTILIFNGDSSFVCHPNQNNTIGYKYKISNYNIITYQNDSITSNKNTEIGLLTQNTLILKINNIQWKYKRITNKESVNQE